MNGMHGMKVDGSTLGDGDGGDGVQEWGWGVVSGDELWFVLFYLFIPISSVEGRCALEVRSILGT